MKALIFLAFLFISLISCKTGVDIPNPMIISTDLWKCLSSQHHVEFLTARAYRSYGVVDPNVLTNIHNAHASGIKEVDVYIFPCFPCANPKKQVQDTIEHLKNEQYGVIWVDVEEYQWGKDKAANRKFLEEMFDELDKTNKKVGIYTNWHEWDVIVGNDWTRAAKYYLWYPHWDKDPSFKDFRQFGGWTKPYRKQLTCDTYFCNEKFLQDYEP